MQIYLLKLQRGFEQPYYKLYTDIIMIPHAFEIHVVAIKNYTILHLCPPHP